MDNVHQFILHLWQPLVTLVNPHFLQTCKLTETWMLLQSLYPACVCVPCDADTGMSTKFLTQEHPQMRRMRTGISPCTSVLVWHLWVNRLHFHYSLLRLLSGLYNHPQCSVCCHWRPWISNPCLIQAAGTELPYRPGEETWFNEAVISNTDCRIWQSWVFSWLHNQMQLEGLEHDCFRSHEHTHTHTSSS